MVQGRIKFKKFNILLSALMILVFVHNLIFFSLPMFLMGDGVVLGNTNTFTAQFNFPTFNEVENLKGFAKVTILAVCSILAFKLLVNFVKDTKIKIFNFKSEDDFEIGEGKAIDLLDCHNPFLYSCKVQALRN